MALTQVCGCFKRAIANPKTEQKVHHEESDFIIAVVLYLFPRAVCHKNALSAILFPINNVGVLFLDRILSGLDFTATSVRTDVSSLPY